MDFNTLDQETVQKKQKFHQILYVQVIFAIILGILIGHFYPELGESLKPLGDAFIKIVKMIIAPVIFLTVVTGIASMTNMSRVGRVTGKAMLYFLTFSSLALVVGMIVANIIQPGKGLNIDPATLVNDKVNSYVEKAHATNITDFFMNIIPQTLVSPLAGGEILQVLFVAVLFGISLAALGDRARPITDFLNNLTAPVFYLVGMLMKLAPIGAFGAMAFTIGAYGIESIGNLLLLIMTFYITAVLFVLIILGAVARYNGFSIIDLIRYIKDELWLVLGTSSSEAALPSLMDKMQKAGCEKSVVGLVIPTGYSFNLDGTGTVAKLAMRQPFVLFKGLTFQKLCL
ncbi:cation:dicarboxylate symporter family transporter, partial [Acinetobacter baumannii]|uniref:cation:dicarboxylate symporter family transporter n=1 Tax=Acinetobacter baumannii TaxID=470 RepID=UPI0020905A71